MTAELPRSMFPPNMDKLTIPCPSRHSVLPVLEPSASMNDIQLEVVAPADYDSSRPFAKGPLKITLTDRGTGKAEIWNDLLLLIPFDGKLNWRV